MTMARRIPIEGPRNFTANTAKLVDTLRTTVISGTKPLALTVVDSITRPRTAGTKTSRSRIKGKQSQTHANMPGMKRPMPWIVTHSTRP